MRSETVSKAVFIKTKHAGNDDPLPGLRVDDHDLFVWTAGQCQHNCSPCDVSGVRSRGPSKSTKPGP